jgi:hypothetical protein
VDSNHRVSVALARPAVAKAIAAAKERSVSIEAKTLKGMGDLAGLDFNNLWEAPPTPKPDAVAPAETKGTNTIQALQLGMKG